MLTSCKRVSALAGTLSTFTGEKVDVRRLIQRGLREEWGQDLIEYALLAAFISLIAIVAVTSIGTTVDSWYNGYDATIKTIPSGSGS